MKKLFLAGLAVAALQTGLQAQGDFKTLTIPLPSEKADRFQVHDVIIDAASGEASVLGMYYRTAMIFKGKEGGGTKFASGSREVPSVLVARVSAGKAAEVEVLPVDLRELPEFGLERKEYKTSSVSHGAIGNSETDVSLTDLRLKYPSLNPKAFAPRDSTYVLLDTEAAFKGYTFVQHTIKFKYSPHTWQGGSYTATPKRTKVAPAEGLRNMFVEAQASEAGAGTIYLAVALDNGGDRYAIRKNRRYGAYNVQGEVIHEFEVNLPYPKDPCYSGLLSGDKNTPDAAAQGAIFFYGRPPMLGKKRRDPDKRNHEVVILNQDGSAFYKGTFQTKTEKRRLNPVYAYRQSDVVHVLATGFYDEHQLALLTFNGEGLMKDQPLSYDQMMAVTQGPWEKGAFSGSREYVDVSQYALADDGRLSLGIVKEKVAINPKEISSPEEIRFHTLFAVQYDAQGVPVKAFAVPRPEKHTLTAMLSYELVHQKEGVFTFLVKEAGKERAVPDLLRIDTTAGKAKFLDLPGMAAKLAGAQYAITPNYVVLSGKSLADPAKLEVFYQLDLITVIL